MTPKFIRFRGEIINLSLVCDIAYKEKYDGNTKVDYGLPNGHAWYKGDCVDEIWALIKLAMKKKPEEVDEFEPI